MAPDVEYAQLNIGRNVVVSADGRYTDNSVTITNAQEGQTITLRSKERIEFTERLYLRVAANCKDQLKKSCYTPIISFDAIGYASSN